MSENDTLFINEIFLSIQGESLSTGEPTTFVRLSGCPLRCSYCDTGYAFKDGKTLSYAEILKKIRENKTKYVTVTGGEPLAQKNCFKFLDTIAPNYEVSLETSNAYSIKSIHKDVIIVLDIKTPKSNESDSNIEDNYNHLKNNDQIKFVICDQEDYEWSVEYMYKHKLNDKCKVLFSPSYEEMDPKYLAEMILKDNIPVRLQIQLHKFLWGDARGK